MITRVHVRRTWRRLTIMVLALLILAVPGEIAMAGADTASAQGVPTSCTYFKETGHKVCAGFLRYWRTYGGAAIFGYPVSKEFVDNGLTVQYFERARFEWHPGSDPARWDVQLGRLGAQAVGTDLSATLNLLRAKVDPFEHPNAANSAGWKLVSGLDYCMDMPGVGGMGFHYINTAMLDTSLDPLTPEAMVYPPGSGDDLTLGAVEWIVPAAAWDAQAHGQLLPEVLGHQLHLNKQLGVYVLHAWIFTDNPAGLFMDWNPTVSCPK